MLLHKAIQSALFRAMALVMYVCASLPLDWPLTKSLQALLQSFDLLSIPWIDLRRN